MTTCKKTLDKAAPVKQKYVRSNQSPFLNKQILKAIMNRTRLRNKFLRTRSAEDRFAYNQQRDFCLSLKKIIIITLIIRRLLIINLSGKL